MSNLWSTLMGWLISLRDGLHNKRKETGTLEHYDEWVFSNPMTINYDYDYELLDILTRRANGDFIGDQLVQWALRALESGVESRSLIILAGLPIHSSREDADPYFDRTLSELQIDVPDLESLRQQYLVETAKQIVAGNITVQTGLMTIHSQVIEPLGHPEDLRPWDYLWEGNSPDITHPGPSKIEHETLTKEYATQFLKERRIEVPAAPA